jgi:hypothetical protein
VAVAEAGGRQGRLQRGIRQRARRAHQEVAHRQEQLTVLEKGIGRENRTSN